MKEIKLILLDMDGTLCDGNSQVPDEFFPLVYKMREKGICIGIASGRNGGTIRDCFGSAFEEMACISTNGTVNYIDGEIISTDYLDKDVVYKLIEKSETIQECSLQLFFPDIILMADGNPLAKLFNDAGFGTKTVKNLYNHMEDVVLISTVAMDMKTDFSKEFLKVDGPFKIAQSGYGCIDYMPIHVSKAYGAKKICDRLGISLNQVMAIGDAGNDLELLQAVGYPVAMKNAMDEVKEVAKYITPKTNLENGCIEFIKEYFGVN